MWYNVELLM